MYAAIAIGVVVLVGAALLFRRRDTGYKVDEFARARSLTTEWARRSSAEPVVEPPADAGKKRSGEDRRDSPDA
ncbi:MAG: hypothetical protein QOG52_2803 [Frankiaceae bacterium]|nr:hypothetical protein [Frankiaceae bacterium]